MKGEWNRQMSFVISLGKKHCELWLCLQNDKDNHDMEFEILDYMDTTSSLRLVEVEHTTACESVLPLVGSLLLTQNTILIWTHFIL